MNNDSVSQISFPTCPVCSSRNWGFVYKGPVRDGSFGSYRDSTIRRCAKCGVDRLMEDACLTHDAYESTKYRALLDQDHDINKYFASNDELANFMLNVILPIIKRGKTIADIGCGGGSLLDHLKGIGKTLIAIEPAIAFSDSLRLSGYHWFGSSDEAIKDYAGLVDVVISNQVIEHVCNPKEFLNDIGRLLVPGGIAVVSTPNRWDILMELLPDDFRQFFYRTQHRWMFDAESLSNCAASAGLIVQEIRHVHRYGIANTMHWLNEKKPRGRDALPPLDCTIDKHWQSCLESNGRSDNLYIILSRGN